MILSEIIMPEIKLFISDIDGVWTDGGMYYDNSGNEWKKFNTSDSAGVLFLKLLNIPTAIITGEDTQIVRRRAEKLKVPYLYMGIHDKLEVANALCKQLGIGLSQVAFIGDDINDINLLKSVGLSACPLNAPHYVKKFANFNINVKGGDGAFRNFVEIYLEKTGKLDLAIKLYLDRYGVFEQ